MTLKNDTLLVTATFWIALFYLSLLPLQAGPEPRKLGDPADLAAIMAGEYIIIGKYPESNETYLGHIALEQNGAGFNLTRTVGDHVSKGTATFETAGGADHIPVLRMRFTQGDVDFGGTYQWKTDLDNFFRFTGYVYPLKQMVDNPGMEALFPMEPLKHDDE